MQCNSAMNDLLIITVPWKLFTFQGWVLLSFLQTFKPAIISLVIWLQRPPYWLHLQPSCHPTIHQPLDFPALAPPVNQPARDGPNMAHGGPDGPYMAHVGPVGPNRDPCEPSAQPLASASSAQMCRLKGLMLLKTLQTSSDSFIFCFQLLCQRILKVKVKARQFYVG